MRCIGFELIVCYLWRIQEHLFNLKFAAKGLERNAKKSEKEERAEKIKLKQVCYQLLFAEWLLAWPLNLPKSQCRLLQFDVSNCERTKWKHCHDFTLPQGLNDTGIGLVGTGQYSQVLDSIVIGGYFLLLWHPIQYLSDSSQHHPHASERLFSSTCDLYSDSCNRLSGHHADMLLFSKHNHCHHHRVWGFFRGHCSAVH